MALPLSVLKDPNAYGDKKSAAFLTVVHEATHAVKPNATTDRYYEHHEHFKKASVQEKRTTADYYRAAVRQIATGQKEEFIPGLAVVNNKGRSPELISAAKEADKILNAAWVSAIRIHGRLRKLAHALNGKPLSEQTQGYQETRTFCLNASRLLGLTLHRALWEATTQPKILGTPTKAASFSRVESESWSTKTTSADKTFPTQVTGLDLSIVDNKIAMLGRLNGKGEDVLVEPGSSLTPNGRVDHVITQVLTTCLPRNQGYVFTKSVDKDVIVIKSLANLHESVNNQKDLHWDTLTVGLPEPMKTYETKVWA